jgi:hypothetical protein
VVSAVVDGIWLDSCDMLWQSAYMNTIML